MKAKAMLLCCCVLASGVAVMAQHQPVMPYEGTTQTGDSVSDVIAFRSLINLLAPKGDDDSVLAAARAAKRSAIIKSKPECDSALALWRRTTDSAINNYNSQQQDAASVGAVSGDFSELYALQNQLNDQLDASDAALKNTLTGFGVDLSKHAQEIKSRIIHHVPDGNSIPQSSKGGGAAWHLVNASLHMPRVSATTISTFSNGNYTETEDFSFDSTSVYLTVSFVGYTTNPSMTCAWDAYHQMWQPPGCSACGNGLPCHSPSISAYIGGVGGRSSYGSARPPYYWNISKAVARDAINPTLPPVETQSSVNVFCNAANGDIVNDTPPALDFSYIELKAYIGTYIGPFDASTSLCVAGATLCTAGPFATAGSMTVATDYLNQSSTSWNGYSAWAKMNCAKLHSQGTWYPANCYGPEVSELIYSNPSSAVACDTYPH